eukprot:1264563-Ditylum_brightwellii.AAC.1
MAVIAQKSDNLPTIHSSQLVLPQWIRDNKKFNSSTSKPMVDVDNFALMYQSILDQQLILPGWHSTFIPAATVAHISATGLTCDCPESLIKALAPTFADRAIWHASYMEELQGLIALDTFQNYY